AASNVVQDGLQLRRADLRAHLRLRIQWIADDHLARALGQLVHELVVGSLVDEHARAGVADLSLVTEDSPEAGVDRRIEVRVGEDDLRALAAELEGDLLEVRLCRGVEKTSCGAYGSGEADLVDAGVARQRLSRRISVAGHDVDNAIRQTGLLPQLAELQRSQRSQLGRLEDQ